MRAYERLLKYVTVRTPSDETSTTVPSSACQFDLAQDLIREFINLGLPKARTDEKCYVYAQIPATPGYENCPKIGFIAHLDTVSDFCDKKIVPVVTENYDGRDLPLGGSDGRVLSVSMFPHLKDLKGRTLITSNGDTILGADDKAGVAEIMTMAERVLTENIHMVRFRSDLLRMRKLAEERIILMSKNLMRILPTPWTETPKVRFSMRTSMPQMRSLRSKA